MSIKELHLRTSVTVVSSCSEMAIGDLKNLDDTIKKRLKWSDTKLLRSILVFLDTRCWPSTTPDNDSAKTEAVDDKGELRSAMEYIVTVFREPLEAKQTCIAFLLFKMNSRRLSISIGSTW